MREYNGMNFDDENERLPEYKQNQVSEKFVIAVMIIAAIILLTVLVLRTLDIIPVLVMRLIIYPILAITVIIYLVVKNKNRTL